MTPRIAPFRTRTLHSPQHFHTLPIPNALNLPNVRSALPYPLLLETCPEEPRSRRPSVRGRVHSDLIEREKSRREREEGKSEEGTGEESKNGDTVEGAEVVREGVTVDQDSILSLLPTIARMMRTLQPRIDAAAKIAVQVEYCNGRDYRAETCYCHCHYCCFYVFLSPHLHHLHS